MLFPILFIIAFWLGIALSFAKAFGYFPDVSWIAVTYPLWGSLLGVFVLGFCECYQPARHADLPVNFDDDDDLTARPA